MACAGDIPDTSRKMAVGETDATAERRCVKSVRLNASTVPAVRVPVHRPHLDHAGIASFVREVRGAVDVLQRSFSAGGRHDLRGRRQVEARVDGRSEDAQLLRRKGQPTEPRGHAYYNGFW